MFEIQYTLSSILNLLRISPDLRRNRWNCKNTHLAINVIWHKVQDVPKQDYFFEYKAYIHRDESYHIEAYDDTDTMYLSSKNPGLTAKKL